MKSLTTLLAITCFFIIIEATNPLNDQTREKRQYHHHRNRYHHRHDVDSFDYDNNPAQPFLRQVHERLGEYLFGGQRNDGSGFPEGFSNPQGPPHGRPGGFGPPGPHHHHGPPGRGHGPPDRGYGPPDRGYGPPDRGYGPTGHHHGRPSHHHGPPGHFGGPPRGPQGRPPGRWPPGRRGKPRYPNPNNIDFKFPEKREKYEEPVKDDQSKIVAYVEDNFPVILLADDDIRR